MAKALIKMVYRQTIDFASHGNFERNVFHASYEEFLLKSQAYNLKGKFSTFEELKSNDGRANSLHNKLSFAVGHFIRQLNNQIPGLKDTLGYSLPFDVAEFKLLASSIADKSVHKVALDYNTGIFTLHEIMGEYLLLSNGEKATNSSDEPVETFSLNMQPGLSITSYQQLTDKVAEPLSNVRRFYFPKAN